MQSGDKISVKEYASILTICIALKLSDATPTLLYKVGKNAAWAIPIISSLIVFIPLSCLLALLERYKDKSFVEIIFTLTGKYIGFIICFIILISMILLTSIDVREYLDIMSTIYFPKTPLIVLGLVFIAFSWVMAKLGVEAIGRTAWMVIPWLFASLILFIILTINIVNLDFLFPIGGAGIKHIFSGGVTYSTIFFELILFSTIFPRVKDFNSFKKASYFTLGFTTLELSIFIALYAAILDYPPVVITTFPFQTVSRLIYGGRFLSNLEAFFFLFGIIGSIVRFGMYVYANTSMLSNTLKLKNVSRLVTPVSGLMLLLALLPENYFQNLSIFKVTLINLNWIPVYITPCALLFISQKRGDYKL
jgi:spore germination protein KB